MLYREDEMEQHYKGKVQEDISALKTHKLFENKLFLNDGMDSNFQYNNMHLERCTFSKISFKDVKIKYIEYKHCVFIECYFKKAVFDKVDFRNCIFIKCDFNNMKITDTCFFYTEWENTFIKFEELYNCLPRIYNYRSRLCRIMARNCLSDGNVAEYRKYFFEVKHASENKYKEIILRRTDYYRTKYTRYDSLKHIFKFIFSKLNGLVWGYGEKIENILYSSIFIIVAFSFLYTVHPQISGLKSSKNISALYVSICNFLTISPHIIFNDLHFKYITALESFFGMAFMGFFIAALFRNVNSR